MSFQHPYWKENHTPVGIELSYIPRGGIGFVLAFLFSTAIFSVSLYIVLGFLKNWFIDHAEILMGGVIVFFMACGGMYLGFRFFKHLFRRITYTLGHGQLKVMIYKFGTSIETLIDKASIKEVLQLYTPPTQSEPQNSPGTWVTCLVYHTSTGERKEFFLEGTSQEESNYLISIFSNWAGVTTRTENTSE